VPSTFVPLPYGLNLTRVLAITSNSLRQRSGDTYLVLGDHELLLPPVLADLLTKLPCPGRRSTLPDIETEHRLLFPGRTPTDLSTRESSRGDSNSVGSARAQAATQP
jgi:hypothetical protein